jgi:peptidoglycan/LPS O-acetylase OafA/YrhL
MDPKERFGSRPRMYGSLVGVLLICALGTAFFPQGASALVGLIYGATVGGIAWLWMYVIEKPSRRSSSNDIRER